MLSPTANKVRSERFRLFHTNEMNRSPDGFIKIHCTKDQRIINLNPNPSEDEDDEN